jgi:signal transduction histidine kinase
VSPLEGLVPASLRFRIRLVVFASLVLVVMGVLVRPLGALLAQPSRTDVGLLVNSALVLGCVVALVVLAEVASRWLADAALTGLDGLAADVRRASVAEARGRRGDSFLEARKEVSEVARLRSEARVLHRAHQERRLADQTWLGAAVHDVKAGLAGLSHLLDAEVSQRAAEGGQGVDLVDAARAEARRLSLVLAAMMGYLRTAQAEPERTQDVDLTEAARVAVDAARRQRTDIDVTLESGGTARVLGDRTLLAQAISNLIENAVRVARTQVRVTVYPGVVRIEDDGPGLPGDLATLTDPFTSERVGDGARTAAKGSLGLGLYIAHRVLEGHDGGLAVERTDPQGTVLLAYVGRAL